MYTHILFPTDGSKLSDNAAQHAIMIAKRLGAKITALHVTGQFPPIVQDESGGGASLRAMMEFEQAEAQRAEKILGAVKEAADKAGVECATVTISGSVPYAMIIEEANKLQCDLIVMASHGRRGLRGLLLGSETVRVLTHSKIPVLVCR